MTALARISGPNGPYWVVRRAQGSSRLGTGLAELLGMPLSEARSAIEAAGGVIDDPGPTRAPTDDQEIWAAGVSYLRSRDGRIEESSAGSIYQQVYEADRPELFFKAAPGRSVGDGADVGIRADSSWNVPEAELAVVINAHGEVFGYTIGNDMSSRSIEGENPLYLPQAKVYEASCALGPEIVAAWDAPEFPLGIRMSVERDGAEVFSGETSTASLARSIPELVDYLRAAMDFPAGVILLTGTGIVPEADFTLSDGDLITIAIDGLGELHNRVRTIGRRP